MSEHTHPDIKQVFCKEVTDAATPYEIYPDSAYVLSAKLSPRIGVVDMDAILYTSPSPENAGDDEGKIPLYIDTQGRPDYYDAGPGGLFFENGIYAKLDATTAGDDAFLQVVFVPRKQHCAAFPRVEEVVRDCWDEARNDGKKEGDTDYEPYLENFTNFERDNQEEGGGASSGTGLGGIPL